MPTSNLRNAPVICQMVRATGARKVLDFGPGHGKYGVLLREYAGVEVVDAVEAWEPYIERFNLNGIYDRVFLGDALEMTEGELAAYDCVLTVSSIEHVPKEPAVEWIRRIRGSVVVATPQQWMQENHEVPTERHRSLWSVDDFRRRFPLRFAEDRSQLGAVLVRLKERP